MARAKRYAVVITLGVWLMAAGRGAVQAQSGDLPLTPAAPPAPVASDEAQETDTEAAESGGAPSEGPASGPEAGAGGEDRSSEGENEQALDPAKLEYRQLIVIGLREFGAGNWPEAIRMFEAAHAIDPNARTLRGLGHAHFENRSYVRAVQYLQEALESKRRPLTDAQRRKTKRVLERARRFVVHLEVEVKPKSAKIFVDAYPAQYDDEGRLLVDPGVRNISIQQEGYMTHNQQIDVLPGRDGVLRVELQPLPEETLAQDGVPTPTEGVVPERDLAPYPRPPGPASVPVATWVLGGTGVAMLAGSVVTGLRVSTIHGDLEEQCSDGTCPANVADDLSEGKTMVTLTNILVAGGVVSLTAGAIWWLIDSGSERSAPSVATGFSCTTDGCSAAVTGAF